MNPLVYFAVIPALASLKAILQGYLSKGKQKELPDLMQMNGWMFLCLSLVLLPIYFRGFPSASVYLPAFLYALLCVAFQMVYAMAFHVGPVGLTTVFSCFSLVIPMLVGLMFYQETVSAWNLAGLLLLAFPLILLPKRDGKAASKRWFFFAILTLLTSGLANASVMILSRSAFSDYDKQMFVLISDVFCIPVCFGLAAILRRGRTFERPTLSFFCKVVPMGVALGFHTLLTSAALRQIPSVVYYPIVNILTITLAVASDYVLYREKLTKRQVIGLIFGAACIVLLNLK